MKEISKRREGMHFDKILKIQNNFIIMMVCFLLFACSGKSQLDRAVETSHPDLQEHSKEFRQEIIRVTDGVYVAIGYGLANSILLEGEDGVVIVDTMESEEAARTVKAAFTAITAKPLKAIIYTHYHPDHVFGTTVMAGKDNPQIISHALTLNHLDRIVSVTRDTTYTRATRQFGTMLPEGGVINCGIGPHLDFRQDNTIGLIRPTRTFRDEELKLTVAGIRMELYHAPEKPVISCSSGCRKRKSFCPRTIFIVPFQSVRHSGNCLSGCDFMGQQHRSYATVSGRIHGPVPYKAHHRRGGNKNRTDQLPRRYSVCA